MRTFRLINFGCKVNQYEGQQIRELLEGAGMREVEDGGEEIDLFVVNTCGVTRTSAAQARRTISRLKEDYPSSLVVATGCCSAIEPEVMDKADVVVPQEEKMRLLSYLSLPAVGDIGGISAFRDHARAFLKVQDGCDSFCAYCAVPLARGVLRSKPPEAVRMEVRRLVDAGYREIVLCGTNLGRYGCDLRPGVGFHELIDSLAEMDAGARFRLSSINVQYVTDAVVRVVASSDDFCKHFHLPLQSGSDDVLRRMGRGYTVGEFVETIERIRDAMELPAVSTDCMVGFPGETDDDFRKTLKVCLRCGFSRIHVFRFSPRPRTRAYSMAGRVTERIVHGRMEELKNTAAELARSFASAVSRRFDKVDVVVERSEDGVSFGTSSRYLPVRIEGCVPVGERREVSLTGETSGTVLIAHLA